MMSGAAAISSSGETMRSLALLARRQLGKDVDAAGDLDQLRHPADAGDHRLVPFLEIDPRPACERGCRARAPASSRCSSEARQRIGLRRRADQRAERADHVEDAGDVALVEGMHRDAAADQFGGDVGLQVGEGRARGRARARGSSRSRRR